MSHLSIVELETGLGFNVVPIDGIIGKSVLGLLSWMSGKSGMSTQPIWKSLVLTGGFWLNGSGWNPSQISLSILKYTSDPDL